MKQLPIILMIAFIVSGCSGAKFLQDGESYYGGANLVFKRDKIEDKQEIQTELQALVNPEPNSVLLGQRPTVWFYHMAGELKKEKGIRHWIKTKLGKKPILISDVDAARTARLLENRLNNNGFFNAGVTHQFKNKKNATVVHYIISPRVPYHYDSIYWPVDTTEIVTGNINKLKKESLLAAQDRYDLDNMKKERSRLEKGLKDAGFYYFDDDYLLFRADSTIGNHQIGLYLHIKESTPAQAKQLYEIGDVNIFANYNIDDKSAKADTSKVAGKKFFQEEDQFRPEIIADHVVIEPGQVYNKENELITLNRLIQLEVFKYVNIEYNESTDSLAKLQTNIYLTPYQKKSIRLELQAVSKSNDFVGPNLGVSFRNRNFLRGAERYEFNLNIGYEIQVGGGDDPLNSLSIGFENVLTVPRILTPFFRFSSASGRFIPQTKFKLGYETLNRINFFNLNSLQADYGFTWNETKTKQHKLFPVNIDFIQLGKVSDEFQDILNSNPLLSKSYEEQFIVGSTYSFSYNSQADEDREKRSNFYFNGNVDISGNLVHLTQNMINEEANTEEIPFKLFGTPYAQFIKSDLDFRFFFDFTRKSKLATRLIAGVGYAYGNSVTLPYTKQFSIGGANSIRAFRARSIGPGTYQTPDSLIFVDQTADLKFEVNAEYRFPVIGAFKGAVFLDAGNIWTIREDSERVGGKFDSSKLFNDLALGTGLGLRFDAQFFVLRFDLAFPLRIPYLPDGDRWLIRDIAIHKKQWRKENLVLNIAIGYPF